MKSHNCSRPGLPALLAPLITDGALGQAEPTTAIGKSPRLAGTSLPRTPELLLPLRGRPEQLCVHLSSSLLAPPGFSCP